jgi:hypothetical protein
LFAGLSALKRFSSDSLWSCCAHGLFNHLSRRTLRRVWNLESLRPKRSYTLVCNDLGLLQLTVRQRCCGAFLLLQILRRRSVQYLAWGYVQMMADEAGPARNNWGTCTIARMFFAPCAGCCKALADCSSGCPSFNTLLPSGRCC